MKKYNKIYILCLVLALLVLPGCYEDEVADVVSPDEYPTYTVTSDYDGGEIREGDVIKYTIKMDKMRTYATPFALHVIDESADDIIEFENVTIPAYSTEGVIEVTFIDDLLPSNEEQTIKYEVGCFSDAAKYLLNSNSKVVSQELTVKNYNDPSGLSIIVGWDNGDDDWDLMVVDEGQNDEWTGWAGATGANPEQTLLLNEEADGVYYLEFDPWDVLNDVVEFEILIGKPDHTAQSFSFTYDVEDDESYDKGWGYRVVKIEKSGSSYTCTAVE
ncbi:hypothetical protein [Plebeiibacterium marinum]|uniref:DUF5017 domain-containing protein n=1 Tax=Plebeiibacterium marinum TaxID=2992111 RepID=A0AAE3SJ64_9BACT|nr:hypothetical protein [Plebeiobacterium marinum]MCW3805402.1 hypothetical protein [Plebeiobacterium marinum]